MAEDAFLPRWLTKRGHRLVFSNGIVVLAVLSCTLLAIAGANVNNLVPFYAIGVFTAFTMAGFGMAKFHHRVREPHWRRKLVINFSAGVTSLIVVLIFVVVKFTEGAYLVVILFIIGVPVLIRLNREYRLEAQVLQRISDRPPPATPPTYPRRTVFVFVDRFDLATLAALRYARSLRPTTLRAVHFVIDPAEADTLREDWMRADRGIVLDYIDCPDRRLPRCAAELVSREAAQPGTHVTAVLPRRSYSPLLGRLLHDRTADKIAAVLSNIQHSVATIVPFDVRSRLEVLHARQVAHAQDAAQGTGIPAGTPSARSPFPAEPAAPSEPAARGQAVAPSQPGAPSEPAATAAAAGDQAAAGVPVAASEPAAATPVPPDDTPGPDGASPVIDGAPPSPPRGLLRRRSGRRDGGPPPDAPAGYRPSYERPAPSAGVNPIGSITRPGRATVEGRVRAVEIRPVERNSVLAVEISDSTGDLTALFYGRSHIPGVICAARVRFRGPVGLREEGPVMINPAYELLAAGTGTPPEGKDSSDKGS